MNEKTINYCSLCYGTSIYITLLLAHPGIILSSCGCFFCQSCIQQITNPSPFCPRCKKQIDFNKSLDLRQKENLRKISFIFDEPETHLKKVIESIKFQKMHQKKYINFLESKIDNLIKENHTLKEQFKSTVTQSYDDQLSTINTTVKSPAYIDLSKIKKIEPKRNTRQSNKMNQATPLIMKNNVNNLNAQTASKNCSANQYNMLNVNINDSSRNMLSPYQGKNNELYYRKDMSNLRTPLQGDYTTARPKSYYNNNTKYYNY